MSKEIYESLSVSFSGVEGAIQSTKKEQTKKGYDTTGIGYQHVVDRFNNVLGVDDWGFDFAVLKESSGTYKSGQSFFEVTVKVSIWVKERLNARHCVGGHISATYSDALKGAITNGFKKTAAFWGVGREAYAGQLDDDTSYGEEVGGYGSRVVPEYKRTGETVERVDVPTCKHGPLVKRVSKSAANPGREFFTCSAPQGKQCSDAFLWVDELGKTSEPVIDEEGDEIVNKELAGQ